MLNFVKLNDKYFFQPGLEPWHTVFYLTAGLLALEFFIFTLFASGEEQSWNTPKSSKIEEEEELRKLSA